MKNGYHLRHKNPEQWAWYCPRLSQIISNSVNLFCLHCVLFSHCTLFWREKNCCWCQGILRYGTSPYFVLYILDIEAAVHLQVILNVNFLWIFQHFTLHSFEWIRCVFIWIFLELGCWLDSFGHHIFMINVPECSHPWSLSVHLIVYKYKQSSYFKQSPDIKGK